jgi:ATP phosphoribosyltransferase
VIPGRRVIGVPKGRLLQPALAYLASRGIVPSWADADDRRITVPTNNGQLFVSVIRPWDCPAFLEAGAVDLAILGTDVIAERACAADLDCLDLPFGRCHLSMIGAGPAPGSGRGSRLRVATRHQKLSRAYLEGSGQAHEIVPLDGSHEAAVLLGLADVAIDLVETGQTLAANDLCERVRIRSFNAALVAPRTQLAAAMEGIFVRPAGAPRCRW